MTIKVPESIIIINQTGTLRLTWFVDGGAAAVHTAVISRSDLHTPPSGGLNRLSF